MASCLLSINTTTLRTLSISRGFLTWMHVSTLTVFCISQRKVGITFFGFFFNNHLQVTTVTDEEQTFSNTKYLPAIKIGHEKWKKTFRNKETCWGRPTALLKMVYIQKIPWYFCQQMFLSYSMPMFLDNIFNRHSFWWHKCWLVSPLFGTKLSRNLHNTWEDRCVETKTLSSLLQTNITCFDCIICNTSSHSRKVMVRGKITLGSAPVVYFLKCPCGLYVGKTENSESECQRAQW